MCFGHFLELARKSRPTGTALHDELADVTDQILVPVL